MHRCMSTLIVIMLISSISAGCGKPLPEKSPELEPAPEDYHADNDIAMTVMSIVDALKVSEPLDSTEYDCETVLTDGQGAPLYTDIQGSPGLWDVNVLDERTAMIRNVYLGDLLPVDLETYLLETLGLTPGDKLDFTIHEAVDDDETEIAVYNSEGVFMRFEVRSGIAPNGIEGPLLSIILSSTPPTGV